MRLLVTADDFGRSASINTAIIRCFGLKLCSRTSIMANMPAFEEACCLARDYCLQPGRVGVHLVLTDGTPLSEEIRHMPRFCDENGSFIYKRKKHLFSLSKSEERAIEAEFTAQVKRCKLHGMHPCHLDSHHHVHEEPAIFKIVLGLARQTQIPFIRPVRYSGKRKNMLKDIYRFSLNQRLRRAGLTQVDDLIGINEYQNRGAGLHNPALTCELMVHPILNTEEKIVDAFLPSIDLIELLTTAQDRHTILP